MSGAVMGNKASDGTNSPVELRVLIGNMTEPELMAALEQVVMHWQQSWMLPGDHQGAVGRAVWWLQHKYGRTPRRAGRDDKENDDWVTVRLEPSMGQINSISAQLGCDEQIARRFWNKLLYWAPEPPAGLSQDPQ